MVNPKITSRKSRYKNSNNKINDLRVRTEIVSLVDENDSNSTYQTTILDLTFPNSLLVNGIAVALEDASNCQKNELGKMN